MRKVGLRAMGDSETGVPCAHPCFEEFLSEKRRMAVSSKNIVAVVAMVFASIASATAQVVEGPLDRVPDARLERLTRGINLSHWMAQAELSEEHIRTYFTEADARLIAEMGFRHARLTLDPEWLWNEINVAQMDPPRLALLDEGIAMLREAGLAVIVDLHPGGAFKHRLTKEVGFPARLAAFWGALAAHLSATDPEWVFLETLNEPEVSDAAAWQAMQRRLLASMRGAAPRHTLIANAGEWGKADDLIALTPVEDGNVVYNFHFYEPMAFTHQGATWGMPEWRRLGDVPYPSTPRTIEPLLPGIENERARDYLRGFGRDPWDRGRLRETLALAVAWKDVYGKPVTCNEFGVYRRRAPRKARLTWLHDVREELERAGIGWCMWDYAGGFAVAPGEPGEREPDAEVLKALGL
jgi:hypothetical protein